MKRLQRYYFNVGIPVLLLVLGTIVFFKEIMGTVQGNPHPQINYLIFILIVVGCVQMVLHVMRINREGRLLDTFANMIMVRKDAAAAKRLLEQDKLTHNNDIADVLLLVLETHGKAIGALHHAAIESEIERFHARQNRRLMLAQFMSGMMVGLGLLGTFIGLLGALNEIGKLIGSFSLGPGMTDPIAAVSELVTRLTEPMKAMGIAFSASLFGVLGSLIMSMLMVFIKSATVELVSLLQSKVSWLTDLETTANSDNADGAVELGSALASLAEQSPMLQGLIVALDQSERRVRQVLTSVQDLVTHVEKNTLSHGDATALIAQVSEQQATTVRTIQSQQNNLSQIEQATARNSDNLQLLTQAIAQQQSQLQAAFQQQTAQLQAFGQVNQEGFQQLQQHQNLQGEQWGKLREQLANHQQGVLAGLQSTQDLLQHSARQSQHETQSRLELAQQIRSALQEQQDRHEQLLHTLTVQLSRLTTPQN
jgi:hypothetical protein